jgi:Fur family zinc uptake transcriptional regulator
MQRLTPLRQKIWDLLCQQQQPLTAYQLVDLYEKKWQKPIHAMSVYRCLDFFIAQHQVQKIQSLNSYLVMQPKPAVTDSENVQELSENFITPDPQLLICDHCHQVFATAFPTSLLQQLQQAIANSFQLQLSGMELHGSCRECSQDHAQDNTRGKP